MGIGFRNNYLLLGLLFVASSFVRRWEGWGGVILVPEWRGDGAGQASFGKYELEGTCHVNLPSPSFHPGRIAGRDRDYRRTSPLTSVSRLFGMGFAHKKLEMPLRSLFLLNEPNDQRLTHEGDFE